MHTYILRDVTLSPCESKAASKSFLTVTFLYPMPILPSLSVPRHPCADCLFSHFHCGKKFVSVPLAMC